VTAIGVNVSVRVLVDIPAILSKFKKGDKNNQEEKWKKEQIENLDMGKFLIND
jgi:hypothetical protein